MAPTPPARPSIKVTKSFTYRGATRKWSNRYFLQGSDPPDAGHWTTLSDAVVTAEKALYDSTCSIVSTTGYNAGSDVPVFTKSYATAGTRTVGSAVKAPGDCVLMLKLNTTARTTKNHPIYLFKYFHNAYYAAGGPADTIDGGMLAAVNTYRNSWLAGFSDGTTTYVLCGPRGATAVSGTVDPFVRHRDFPN